MESATSKIFVVDDEKSVRDSLKWLFNSISLKVETFDSAKSFLEANLSFTYGCLILDVRMQNVSGLQLQGILLERNFSLPVIFLSAYGDAQMGAQAIKRGAIDFLQKPYRNQDLIDAVNAALSLSKSRYEQEHLKDQYGEWLRALSQREKETLDLVVSGKSSKEIARILEVREDSVQEMDRLLEAHDRSLDAPRPDSDEPWGTTLADDHHRGRKNDAGLRAVRKGRLAANCEICHVSSPYRVPAEMQ